MAIYHLSAKVISRGKGQSAIAAAAYRSGERLYDEQSAQQKYYTSRAERIQFTDIMAPKDAPEWAHDRNALWNHAERAEKRKDAQLAREIEVSLPHELTAQQREWLVKDFAREAFVRKGYAVDIAIHAPDENSDDRNHHAHLMVTRRTLGPDGFAATKDWQCDKKQLSQWREQWAHLANRHLERHGHEERIDHRSLKEQGIDREATVHLGYAAHEMTQRGAQSDRMAILQGILDRNEIRLDIQEIERELKALKEEEAKLQLGAAAAPQQTGSQPTKADQLLSYEEEYIRAQAEAARGASPTQKPLQMDHSDPVKALTSPIVPIEIINTRHTAAEEEAMRAASMRKLEAAARADERILRQPKSTERAFGDGAREEAGKVRRERLDTQAQAQQEVWRKRVEAQKPDQIRPVQAGLKVVNTATGAATRLTDFVTDLLAGAAPSSRVNPDAFTLDPVVRREQQLARIAEREAAEAADRALERIDDDIKAGKGLKSEDIKSLTRQQQEEIRAFGDDAVKQMVDEARKRSERYWKGDERERE